MMIVMPLMWLGFLGLIAWAVWAAFPARHVRANPLDVLKETYARGQITHDQFEQMKKELACRRHYAVPATAGGICGRCPRSS